MCFPYSSSNSCPFSEPDFFWSFWNDQKHVFHSCLLASTELRKTLLVSLSCGSQTCWKFSCSLKVDHLVELQIYQATCARACPYGAIRHEWVGKSNWAALLVWNKSNHWRGLSDRLFLRQALSNGVGCVWSVRRCAHHLTAPFPCSPSVQPSALSNVPLFYDGVTGVNFYQSSR